MKIYDYKEYYCLVLAELILGRICESRKGKADIAAHNKKFKHGMNSFMLAACTRCQGGSGGLVVPGPGQGVGG